MDTNINSTPEGQTPEGADPKSGQTPTPNGQTTSGSKTPIDSLPADVQDYIRRLREEAEEANKQRKAETRAKQLAEEQRLKAQGEYQALAEKYQARAEQLEPVAERYTALSGLVAEQLIAETKDWPAELTIFDPGPDAPIEQRLEWFRKSRPLIERLQQQARANQPGNGPNPRPAQQTPEATQTKFMQQLRASGKYGV
jgi:hypothetical protein